MLDLQTILIFLLAIYLLVWAYKIVYSIFFSPLSNIPGPFIIHIFPNIIWKTSAMKGTHHLVDIELHKKYGPVVRTAGNNVSFISEQAVKEIYLTYNFTKSEEYSIFHLIGETVFSTMKREFHAQRKKIIAPSFSEKSISSVEYLVKRNVDILVQQIDKLASEAKVFDIGKYFHSFTFDVIGDVAFGKSFNMLSVGYHPMIGHLRDMTIYLAFCAAIPILKYYTPNSIKKIYEFSYEAIKNSKLQSDRVTILNALINASDPETGEKLSEKEVAEESILQLAAGTDTTSNSLTWTFYHLIKHPEIFDRVKAEIDTVFPDKETITYTKCKSECVYLSAVIYESLRIIPVASGVPLRKTPKGGKVIDGYFIPEGTTVGVGIMSCQTSPLLWDKSNDFIPERWIDKDGKFKTNSNFMPFLIGPRACLGRGLAWMELYLATASLIRNFSFKLRYPDQNVESQCFVVNTPKSPVEVIASMLTK